MPHPITRPCGTYAAAQRHVRRREPLCAPCVEARRAWWRERAQIAYSIPAFRERENARTAARLAARRASDPQWRERANRDRQARRETEIAVSRRIIDDVAVERFVRGDDTVRLNRGEKACAYREMDRRGIPRNEINRRLRISWATAQSFAVAVCGELVAPAVVRGQNDSEAEQRANATRPLTDTPAYPGGRLMPSIAAHNGGSCQQVAG